MNKSEHAKKFFDNSAVYLANRSSIRLRSEIIRDLLGEQYGKDFLDIGCGDGSLSAGYIAHNQICFLDFSSSMLAEVKQRISPEFQSRATLLEANFEDHQFSKQFDVIFCVGVLAHVKDMTGTIAKVSALLKAGGKAVFQVSDINHFYYTILSGLQRKTNVYGYDLNRISPDKVKTKALAFGLKFKTEIRYPLVYPLIKYLGNQASYKFLRTVYKNVSLSFLSSEYVMLFERSQP